MELRTTNHGFPSLTVGGITVGHLEVDREPRRDGWVTGVLRPVPSLDEWWWLFRQVTD